MKLNGSKCSGGGHAGKGSAHKYNNNNTSGYVNEEIILAQARLRAARETLRRDGDSYNGYAAVATTTAAAGIRSKFWDAKLDPNMVPRN